MPVYALPSRCALPWCQTRRTTSASTSSALLRRIPSPPLASSSAPLSTLAPTTTAAAPTRPRGSFRSHNFFFLCLPALLVPPLLKSLLFLNLLQATLRYCLLDEVLFPPLLPDDVSHGQL